MTRLTLRTCLKDQARRGPSARAGAATPAFVRLAATRAAAPSRAAVALLATATPAVALLLTATPAVAAPDFYLPPGDLIPGSGTGVAEYTVFAPGMRYPVEVGPSYPNSQVYGNGGIEGPGGGQCDAVNYDYPWRDNYCEKRSWTMPLCPSGIGHQGQDIRPATCENKKYWIVASAAGTVTNIGTYSVYVEAPGGQRFDYLHGATDTLAVSHGQQVARGDTLVKLSNNMGDTPTSIHLHFNIHQDVAGVGFVYVSPYMSLVGAYEELMGLGNAPPAGVFDPSSCTALHGWAHDPDTPDAAIAVDLYFGGEKGDPAAVPVQVIADIPRDDLCMSLGSCDHGFEVEVPLSLRDGLPHSVHAYALDDDGGAPVELELSPGAFQCAAPPLPAGVRRWVVSPESLAAWQFSPFWQAIRASDEAVAALPEDRELGEAPLLVRSDQDLARVWLVDDVFRRHVPNLAAAAAWGFDLDTAEIWPDAEVRQLAEGSPLRPAPVLVQGSGPQIWLVDDHQCDRDQQPPDPLCGEPSTPTTDAETGDSGGVSASQGEPETSSGEPGGDSDGASGGGTGGAALPPDYGDDGCGCAQRRPGVVGLSVVLVAIGLRRRRARAS